MYGAVLCLAVAFGVDAGWRRLPEGGFEYVIQLEPETLDALKAGDEFFSDVPPGVRDVRSYRITAGTGELVREGDLEGAPSTPESQPPAEAQSPPESQPPTEAQPSPEGQSLPQGQSVPEGQSPPEAQSPPEGPTPDPDTPAAAEPSPGDQGALEARWPGAPRELVPPDDTSPLSELPEKAVAFMQEDAEPDRPAAGQGGVSASKDAEPAKPWLPLTLAVAGCFGSLGGMLYLGWIAWGYRRQYRMLLERLLDAGDERPATAGDRDSGDGPVAVPFR
jgi:hypothetical protein